MAKRLKLNPAVDSPKDRLDITKEFMKGYIIAKGGEEGKIWFAKIVKENLVEKSAPSNPNKKVKTYDVPKVREAFVNKYFPHLNKKSSAEEDLDEILSWLE